MARRSSSLSRQPPPRKELNSALADGVGLPPPETVNSPNDAAKDVHVAEKTGGFIGLKSGEERSGVNKKSAVLNVADELDSIEHMTLQSSGSSGAEVKVEKEKVSFSEEGLDSKPVKLSEGNNNELDEGAPLPTATDSQIKKVTNNVIMSQRVATTTPGKAAAGRALESPRVVTQSSGRQRGQRNETSQQTKTPGDNETIPTERVAILDQRGIVSSPSSNEPPVQAGGSGGVGSQQTAGTGMGKKDIYAQTSSTKQDGGSVSGNTGAGSQSEGVKDYELESIAMDEITYQKLSSRGKESIFVKLKNRIHTLEVNLNLSNR